MGVLDKLMFWKKDDEAIEVDPDFEVNGCFTLPIEDEAGTDGDVVEPVADANPSEQC